jgi:hypothetical protein
MRIEHNKAHHPGLGRWTRLLGKLEAVFGGDTYPTADNYLLAQVEDVISQWKEDEKHRSYYPNHEPVCVHCGCGPLDITPRFDLIARSVQIDIKCAWCGWEGA